MASPNRPRVGEILLRAGAIDKHQLQSALGEQRRWGRRLGSTLIKMGFIEEQALVRALASQLDMPVATLEGKRIHPDVLGLIPGEVAEKYMVIPLFVKKDGAANCLFVGMEDPSSLDVLDELSFRSGMPVRAVLVGPSELAEAIDRYYCRGETAEAEAAPPDETNPIIEIEPSVAPEPTVAAPTSAAPAEPSGTEELAKFWAAAEDDEIQLDDATEPEVAQVEPESVVEPPSPMIQASAEATEVAPPVAPAPAALERPVSAPAPTPQAPPSSAPPTTVAGDAVASEALASAAIESSYAAADAKMNERMRLGIQALTQLLIEKGVLTLEELHTRMRDLQLANDSKD